MKKTKQIGGLSFGSDEAYNNFLSLPYAKQLEQVTNSFSPKSEEDAVKALKGVRNGDSNRATSETEQYKTANSTGTDEGGNTSESGQANTAKGSGTKKG